jgi:hypothetical protein
LKLIDSTAGYYIFKQLVYNKKGMQYFTSLLKVSTEQFFTLGKRFSSSPGEIGNHQHCLPQMNNNKFQRNSSASILFHTSHSFGVSETISITHQENININSYLAFNR